MVRSSYKSLRRQLIMVAILLLLREQEGISYRESRLGGEVPCCFPMENSNTQPDTMLIRLKFKDFQAEQLHVLENFSFLLFRGVYHVHLRFEMDERFPRGCGASRADGQMLGTPSSSAKL